MGYTHYWYRKPKIDSEIMALIVKDFGSIVLVLDDMGVRLGDGCGAGAPIISAEEIIFNGLSACGHAQNSEISIPWPSKDASGIGNNVTAINGDWFAGAMLQARACDGDCSYETFDFPRAMSKSDIEWQSARDRSDGLYFNCTKTAFRPYDVAVTAFLIIAKHYIGDDLRVTSDGKDEHWRDAKNLCQFHLGYGFDFQMTGQGLIEGDSRITKPITEEQRRVEREADRAAVAAIQANEKEQAIKDLRAKYPWAKSPDVSKNLKKELSLAFPGVKFSVRMRHHGSITISWVDGPTGNEVDAIAGKYESGSFDGMDDCYKYDQSAFGEAVSAVLGRARYIHSSRSFSVPGLFERVCRDLAELQGVPFVSTYQRRDGDTLGLDDYARKVLARTSFPAGAEYIGVDYGEKINLIGACSHEELFKIVHSMTDPFEDLRAVVRAEFDYIAGQERRRAEGY